MNSYRKLIGLKPHIQSFWIRKDFLHYTYLSNVTMIRIRRRNQIYTYYLQEIYWKKIYSSEIRGLCFMKFSCKMSIIVPPFEVFSWTISLSIKPNISDEWKTNIIKNGIKIKTKIEQLALIMYNWLLVNCQFCLFWVLKFNV